jgi:rod shape-determining protein MreC
VYDKQVRRRRAVLVLLVGASLILLTAYFGESPSSPLHAVQRGVAEVLSPVESGASTVLSPVRDVAGWFSDTIHAKSEVASLKRENAKLTTLYDQAEAAVIQNRQLRREVNLDQSAGINGYSPVAANVIEFDPSDWYQTITVDQGSSDGVHIYDPVIGDGGLVGDVSQVGSDYAVVTEITDAKFAAGAEVLDSNGDSGLLVPAVGNQNQLLLTDLPAQAQGIVQGQEVVTSGFKDGSLIQSSYPPDIPIGQVSNADQNTLINSQEIEVTPTVDLRDLNVVQILTRPHATTQRAQAP